MAFSRCSRAASAFFNSTAFLLATSSALGIVRRSFKAMLTCFAVTRDACKYFATSSSVTSSGKTFHSPSQFVAAINDASLSFLPSSNFAKSGSVAMVFCQSFTGSDFSSTIACRLSFAPGRFPPSEENNCRL